MLKRKSYNHNQNFTPDRIASDKWKLMLYIVKIMDINFNCVKLESVFVQQKMSENQRR